MVKIPSLSRRSEPAVRDTNHDGRLDGGDRSTTLATGGDRPAQPVVTDRDDDQTTYRSSSAPDAGRDPRDSDAERRAAARAATARAATGRPAEPEATPPGARPVDAAGTTRTDRPLDRTVDLNSDGARERPIDRGHLDRRHTDGSQPDDGHRDRDADVRSAPEPVVVAGKKPRASLLATLGLIVGVAAVAAVLTGTLAGYGIALGAIGAVLAVLGLVATRRRHIAGKTDALVGMVAGLAAVVLGVLAMSGQYDWPTTDGDWVLRLREWLDSQFVDRF